MANPGNKGQVSTPDNPGNSKLMLWIRDHLNYTGDDCLIWPFGRTRDGYGGIGRAGKYTKAHRYICRWVHGEPPTPKHHAAHACGNGAGGCVNPRHLSWKTPSENSAEGVKHPNRKLTPEQAQQVRALKGKELSTVTAARFGITEGTVRNIQSGRIWNRESSFTRPTLSADDVRAIRAQRRQVPARDLAKQYGVSTGSIGRIQRGKTFKHVPAQDARGDK